MVFMIRWQCICKVREYRIPEVVVCFLLGCLQGRENTQQSHDVVEGSGERDQHDMQRLSVCYRIKDGLV